MADPSSIPIDACPIPAVPPPVRVALTTLPPHACPYLPGRETTIRGFMGRDVDPAIYHGLMDAGFRRSGRLFYQPICSRCRECTPIRVSTGRFAPTKSQRRAHRRNGDLDVTVGPAIVTDEKFDLYSRYASRWHGKEQDAEDGREAFESFLYDSPVETVEFAYRAAGRLMAVGICDVCDRSLSSVYFYFDPDEADRGLGTFGAVFEIDWAKSLDIPFYYLGYWVRDCPSMAYKSNFRPAEVLGPDGVWRDLPREH